MSMFYIEENTFGGWKNNLIDVNGKLCFFKSFDEAAKKCVEIQMDLMDAVNKHWIECVNDIEDYRIVEFNENTNSTTYHQLVSLDEKTLKTNSSEYDVSGIMKMKSIKRVIHLPKVNLMIEKRVGVH